MNTSADDDFRRLPQSGRGIMRKNDLLARIYKHKCALFNGKYKGATEDWENGAHYMLNKCLELAQEYAD